jgi:polar amino acid transport system substrate-binding protein
VNIVRAPSARAEILQKEKKMLPITKRVSLLLSVLILTGLLLAACAPAGSSQPPAPTTAATPAPAATAASQPQPANDLLAEIKARGTLRVSTDLNYAPQSALVTSAERAATTKCGADEFTANQAEGFDIDTAVEIAKRLGVEPCFVTPSWDSITAGSWGGRWDISVGSMTITKDRMKALLFSPAYYYYAAQVAARKGSNIASVDALAGKPVCVGTGTTYETYLKGEDVGIPDKDVKVKAPADVQIVPLQTDAECAQSIKAGRKDFDALLTASTVVDAAIKDGIPIEKVGGPVYIESLAVALDKKSSKDPQSLLEAITKAVNDMHADGSLTKSSQKWYNADLSVVQ